MPKGGAAPSQKRCVALSGTVVAEEQMPLPSRGALVDSATWQPASESEGLPERCELKGHLDMVDPEAPDLNFQLNLPSKWNGRALQYGGSGFNGSLISGLDGLTGSGGDIAKPISRGYATFGDDGGTAGTLPAQTGYFATNRTALVNYGGQAVKRTQDVAEILIKRFYGRSPSAQFFAGGSKGGHEGLVAAQRFGDEYDGIIAFFPANQNQAMVIGWRRIEDAVNRPGGEIYAADAALVNDAVLAVCDDLDGVADGLISDTRGCQSTFDITDLRCDPADVPVPGICLSDAQITSYRRATRPLRLAYPLANGVRSIGGYPFLVGAPLDPSVTALYRAHTEPVLRFFDNQDPSDVTFDYRDYRDRVQELSRILDATSPDIDRFAAHGGKLILVQGTVDNLVTYQQTNAYAESLRHRYGQALGDVVRYYVQPGYDHLGLPGVPFGLNWDSLSALEGWVATDRPPSAPVAADVFSGRTMPLCRYPAWPRYRSGPVDDAGSYRCVDLRGTDTTTRLRMRDLATDGRRLALVTVEGTFPVTAGVVVLRDGRRVLGRRPLGADGTRAFQLPPDLAPGRHVLTASWLPAGFPARSSTSRPHHLEIR